MNTSSPIRSRQVAGVFLLIGVLPFLAGCASFHGDDIRRQSAVDFQEKLQTRSAEVLSPDRPLVLSDCVRIALSNSFSARAADIEARASKLDRKAAFGYFLPAVSVGADYTEWDRNPEMFASRSTEGIKSYRASHDPEILDLTVDAQMPIFMPSAWFFYSMRARGAEISELAADYTRQMLTLEVVSGYFACVALDRMIEALETQVLATTELEKELALKEAEGLILPWQLSDVRALLEAHKAELSQTRRSRIRSGSDLLATMGLDPMSEVSLVAESPLESPEGELPDLILEALLENPRLRIADRQIAIEQSKAKAVIADFLPNIIGFASFSNTSDDFQRYAHTTLYGLSGTLTVFNGFTSVHEYKAAKARAEEEYVRQEQACLNVTLQVINTYLGLQDAADGLKVTELSRNAAQGRLDQVERQWKEGLAASADHLSAMAARDRAEMNVTTARAQHQVAIAGLMNAMGRTLDTEQAEETEDSENDK